MFRRRLCCNSAARRRKLPYVRTRLAVMASPLINATLQTAAEPLCNADCWSILRSPANETSVCNQPHWLPRAPCNEGAGSSWAWDVWARPNAPRHSLHCDGHTFKHSAMSHSHQLACAHASTRSQRLAAAIHIIECSSLVTRAKATYFRPSCANGPANRGYVERMRVGSMGKFFAGCRDGPTNK